LPVGLAPIRENEVSALLRKAKTGVRAGGFTRLCIQ
jgi:hypothetical protein